MYEADSRLYSPLLFSIFLAALAALFSFKFFAGAVLSDLALTSFCFDMISVLV